MRETKKAILELEDGTVFEGKSFGFEKACSGEVVFNTAMTGYPESLTDPSYEGQVLVTTFPLIGNYGAAPKDVQELLGHSDVSTTMNVYAHSTRDAKRKSVRLLDKVVGND